MCVRVCCIHNREGLSGSRITSHRLINYPLSVVLFFWSRVQCHSPDSLRRARCRVNVSIDFWQLINAFVAPHVACSRQHTAVLHTTSGASLIAIFASEFDDVGKLFTSFISHLIISSVSCLLRTLNL